MVLYNNISMLCIYSLLSLNKMLVHHNQYDTEHFLLIIVRDTWSMSPSLCKVSIAMREQYPPQYSLQSAARSGVVMMER